MKLSNTTLKTLIKGAYRYIEEDNYLTFSHYTEEQYNYLLFKDFFSTRALFSSSVKIEFTTDAKEISFDFKNFYTGSGDSVDVYCNGVVTNIAYLKDYSKKDKMIFALPEGKKDVTVYLPIDIRIGIKNFRIEGKWRARKVKRTKVLFIGDSITQGYGAKTTSHTYVNTVARFLNYDVLNQGIGGYYYDEKVLMPMDGYAPDKIILAMGTNQHKSADKEERVANYYAKLHELYPNVPTLAITPLWRGDEGRNEQGMRELTDAIYRESAKYSNMKVVNGFDLVPHVSEYFIDNLHPNSLGCYLYAENLAKKIKELKF